MEAMHVLCIRRAGQSYGSAQTPIATTIPHQHQGMTLSIVPALKARVLAVEFIKNNPRLRALVDHPAGPFTSEFFGRSRAGLCIWTSASPLACACPSHPAHFKPSPNSPHQSPTITAVHFWAPSFKWGISLANIADYNRPPELISVPQQCGAFAGSRVSSHGLPSAAAAG